MPVGISIMLQESPKEQEKYYLSTAKEKVKT